MTASKHLPRALLLAVAIAASMPVAGEDAPSDRAAVAGAGGAAARDQAFVERSLVIAPGQAGDFELVNLQDYPGRPDMGVGVRYRHPDFPDVLLDIFIYPMGRHGRDAALDGLVEAMQGELRQVEESGRYQDLEFGGVVDIDLQRIDSDGTLQPVRPELLGRGGEISVAAAPEGGEEMIVAASAQTEEQFTAASDPDLGRRLPMTLMRDGEPAQSVSFLFYRRLYAFKARVSASASLPSDSFDRFANHAMATIVPQIDIRNAGSCSARTVTMNPDDPGDVGAISLVMQLAVARIRGEREGCSETLDDRVPDGYRGVAIDVSGVWSPAPEKDRD